MVKEGRLLARISEHVVIKVPLIPEGIKATKVLSSAGIRVNVTLCFSAGQALLAAKAGATYVSPFVGRLDDVSTDGMELIDQIVRIYAQYDDLTTQVLAASIRHPQHVVQSALIGADVATVPYKILRQLFDHPLTDKGNAAFLKDWAKVPDRDIVGQVERFLAAR
jgi:transaldolase